MRQITPKQLLEKLPKNKILLMLDYDGTIVSICKKPELAVLPTSTKKLLSSVASLNGVVFSVISGRSGKQISKIIGISKAIYAGNHGLEIISPYFKFKSVVSKKMQKAIKSIAIKIKIKLKSEKGVIVENKGLTLSVHYRLLRNNRVSIIKKIIKAIVFNSAENGLVKIHRGKKVIEIRPNVVWDKGQASLWILNKCKIANNSEKITPIYIGDDITDESAFMALKKTGLTVRVNYKKKSNAAYALKGVNHALDFLKMLVDRGKKNV